MSRLTPRNFKYCDSDFMDSGLAEAMNKLAHYEDLEEQDRLLKLPCLVGSRMYYIGLEGTIYNIQLASVEACLMYADDNGNFKSGYFATKEEAEAKLAEMKEGAE